MKVSAKKVKSSLNKHILADGLDLIMDVEKSSGSWLVDQRDGSKHLDMFSMYASGSVGYNHPSIIEHRELLGTISQNKPTLSDLYNVFYADFVQTFSRLAIPRYLPHTFFIEGGSLAVENALKIAFDWKVRKNLRKSNSRKGSQIIHFKQAFHGRSGYTLSLTNTNDPRKTMYFPKFDWPRIDNPKLYFPISENILQEVKIKEKAAIEQIKEALNNNPDDIAAIIIEPIQGEGGDCHFRDKFFIELRNLCDENEMLLIMDEVQTGIGITGEWWAHQHYSVKPDIISFGKKAQVCGALASRRIEEVNDHVFSESSRINSTWGGNLTDMVRFKIILEIIEKENLLDNVRRLGKHLLEKLEYLSTKFPALVTNSRGLGLFAAFDLPSEAERDKLWERLMKNKLLILPSGDRSIRFRPHLNVKEEELDYAIDIIEKSLKESLN